MAVKIFSCTWWRVGKKRNCFNSICSVINRIFDYVDKLKNVIVVFAIQDKNFFENLAKSFKQRGTSEEFVERRRNDFKQCHEIIEKLGYEKVYIKENEHLYDALSKSGINFENGKGYMNCF